MDYIEQIPSIDDCYPLYIETGWNEMLGLTKQELEEAIGNSFTAVCAYNQSNLIGFGRVVSDGIVYATIYDVIVKPEFQNQGIGSVIVKTLIAKCTSMNIRSIHLFAAKGTAAFYTNIGFVSRPQDAPGMKYFPTKTPSSAPC